MKVERIPVLSTVAGASATVVHFPEQHVGLVGAYLRGLPSDSTRRVYARVLRDLASWLGRDPETASRREIESYREHLEQLGRAKTTIVQHLAAVSGFLQFACDEEVIQSNPAARVRRPRLHEAPIKKGVTAAEVRMLLDICDTTTLIGLRDAALVYVLAVQGLRIHEALGIAVEHVDRENGHHVVTITGKGDKVARVPLAPAVHAAITRWTTAVPIMMGPIFVAVLRGDHVAPGQHISAQAAWKRVRYLAHIAGLGREIHPHLFRHGCATSALAAGVALHRVQDHLRHADPKTTRRYDSQRKSLDNSTGPTVADLIERAE